MLPEYATKWEFEYDLRTEESVDAAREVALKPNPRLWMATHDPVLGEATEWNPDGYPLLPPNPGHRQTKIPVQNN